MVSTLGPSSVSKNFFALWGDVIAVVLNGFAELVSSAGICFLTQENRGGLLSSCIDFPHSTSVAPHMRIKHLCSELNASCFLTKCTLVTGGALIAPHRLPCYPSFSGESRASHPGQSCTRHCKWRTCGSGILLCRALPFS